MRCQRDAPTPHYLHRLIVAQQQFFPYENISKLIFLSRGQTRTARLDEYLVGQEAFDFGGTCVAQNAHFATLLKGLGFDATLIGSTTNGLEDHTSCIVTFGSEAFHIDLGLMSTFTGPLPLRGGVIERSEGYRIIRYTPGNDGFSYKREILRDGEVRRLIEPMPGPRTLESFAPMVTKSFAPDAIFMKTFAIYKVVGDTELSIWNNEFHVSTSGQQTSRTLSSVKDIESVVRGEMGLPNIPVAEAVRILKERNGVDIFAAAKE